MLAAETSTNTEEFNDVRINSRTCVNYTSEDEKYRWWQLAREEKEAKWFRKTYSTKPWQPLDISKTLYRARRAPYGRTYLQWCYANSTHGLRICIGNNNNIGSLAKLTDSYLLVSDGEEADIFSATMEIDVPDISIIRTSLAGCRVVGTMCVGNNKGLLIPDKTFDTELEVIKERVPESVIVNQLSEKLSALGNVIACNDKIALIHPELDKETEEIIADTLQVEVIRWLINNNPLIGSNCVLHNKGGIVNADITQENIESLSSFINLPLYAGTVNGGLKNVASGMLLNNRTVYAGMKTTAQEFRVMEESFRTDSLE